LILAFQSQHASSDTVQAGSIPESGHRHGTMGGNSPSGSMGGMLDSLLKKSSGSMDPNGNIVTRRVEEGICKDCSILRGRAALTNEDGQTISIGSGVYLHHIGLLPNKMALSPQIVKSSCPSGLSGPRVGSLPDMLFVQGVENFTTWYTAPDGSINSGYYAPNDGWRMTMEVVNYKLEKRNVYITLDYDYLPGKPETSAHVSYVSVTSKWYERYSLTDRLLTSSIRVSRTGTGPADGRWIQRQGRWTDIHQWQ